MVLTLAIPLRSYYHLEGLIPIRDLGVMAKVKLTTGLIVAYSYVIETFISFYSGNSYERFMMMNCMTGPYAVVYWGLITFNLVLPQALWFRRVRRGAVLLFIVSLIINVGMWLERFVIIAVTMHTPSQWDMFYPTKWDWATLAGSFGLFFVLFYLIIRFLPMISIAEARSLVHETEVSHSA